MESTAVTLEGSLSRVAANLDNTQTTTMPLLPPTHDMGNEIITCTSYVPYHTGELGYEGPLYDGFLHMTDDMLGTSPMHIKYSSYVNDGFCI